jgi:hypothetical protein
MLETVVATYLIGLLPVGVILTVVARRLNPGRPLQSILAISVATAAVWPVMLIGMVQLVAVARASSIGAPQNRTREDEVDATPATN